MARVIKHTIEEKNDGCIYPNEGLKDWFFPNWFNKEHFEIFIGRRLSDNQFQRLKEYLLEYTDIWDEISNVVSGYLNESIRGGHLEDVIRTKKKKGVK